MSIGQRLDAEVAAGTGPSLLVHLAAASRLGRDALGTTLAGALHDVGDGEGETWLNLFGLALDAGAPFTAERLLETLEHTDGLELRRHLLGRYAWSWCTLAGIDDIEAAAAGDRTAADRLLAHPRYYGGHAAAALSTLLPLDAEETRRRIVRAIETGAQVLPHDDNELAAAEAEADSVLAEARDPLAAIEELTRGYRYVPEIEAERVVLVPHLEPTLPLVLAQHRSARIVAYLATPDRSAEEGLVTLGRALSDPKRVEILALVGRGIGRAGDLVDATGLTRSTVHHHLAQLRAAGLVALEGNARAYTYVPRLDAQAEIAALLAAVAGTDKET